MTTLAGLPYTTLAFDKKGKVAPPDALCPPGTTDLIVVSHGWKNDVEDARTLYERLIRHMLAAAGGGFGGKTLAVVGVTWPAFRYEPDLSLLRDGHPEEDGGAAAFGADVDAVALRRYAERIAVELDDADPTTFGKLAVIAKGGGDKANELVDRLRTLTLQPDVDPPAGQEHRELFQTEGSELVAQLEAPPSGIETVAPQDGEGAGSAASFTGDLGKVGFRWLAGGKAAVARVLNQFTYYEMKARAGTVGAGLAAVLDTEVPKGVRVHLVGHSFGARLVTSAASGAGRMRPTSLVLLQGAFSHNGLGQRVGPKAIDGAFRNVVAERRVSGPIVVTHTRRDTAVGFFYALASTLSNDINKGMGVAKLIGGPDDLHGGIGANGAQALLQNEAVAHVATKGHDVALAGGRVNNILVDAIVSEHNDVANADCGRLVFAAIRGT